MPRINQWMLYIALLCAVIISTESMAHPLCKDNSLVSGLIAEKFQQLGGKSGPLGCVFSGEYSTPGSNARRNDFEKGQIIWSPDQRMIVAAYVQDDGNIHVSWWVIDTYSYAHFNVRLVYDTESSGDVKQVDEPNKQTASQGQSLVLTTSHGGTHAIVVEGCDDPDPSNLKPTGSCNQGWSEPVFVDKDFIDVAVNVLDGGFLPAAKNSDQTRALFDKHVQAALRRHCDSDLLADDLKKSFGAGQAEIIFDKLYMAEFVQTTYGSVSNLSPWLQKCQPVNLIKDANDALEIATKTTEVGSDVLTSDDPAEPWLIAGGAAGGTLVGAEVGFAVGGPVGTIGGAIVGGLTGGGGVVGCVRNGDYDMALSELIPIFYRYGADADTVKQAPNVYQHILTDQAYQNILDHLLTESGGASNVVTSRTVCNVVNVPETENHIMMTESARYLTNQLLLREAFLAYSKDHDVNKYKAALKKYDNSQNGMDQWMLGHLHGFMKHDFHEYNARPYSRLSILALHNLAEYAQLWNVIDAASVVDTGVHLSLASDTQRPVSIAAKLVLDYLSARFAISNSGLRRAVPFRRKRDSKSDYPSFFGNYSDEETWWGVTMFGTTQTLINSRYGRADWGAGGDIGGLAVGQYRVPDVITDIATRNSSIESDPLQYFQVIRHEGMEGYSRSNNYLISAGGVWQDNTDMDKVQPFSGGSDTNGAALPTTLMPAFGLEASRNELVRIEGFSDYHKRYNSCIAPGFACGLNPVVPDFMVQRYRPVARPCSHNVSASGAIQAKWNDSGKESGRFGCPITDEADIPVSEGRKGRFQLFERGEILFSESQQMVLAAFYKPASNNIAVEWNITNIYTYDLFNVRWDLDGINKGQHSVLRTGSNGSNTGGTWTLPTNGFGKYRLVIEGCDGTLIDGNVIGSVGCKQGFSAPIYLNLPAVNSCVSVEGNWSFVDLTAGCSSTPNGHGVYAAVYKQSCLTSDCEPGEWNNQSFGFFEAMDEPNRGGSKTDPFYWFNQFKQAVLAVNGSKKFDARLANEYSMVDGSIITFKPDHSDAEWGILNWSPSSSMPDIPKRMDDWRLAKGNVINSDGNGCIVVNNAKLHQTLVLDFRDPKYPVEAVTNSNLLSCDWPMATQSASLPFKDVPFGYGPDTCLPGFVWRDAYPGDHVCVTPDTRTQTAVDNQQAAFRREPNGGSYGPDTCKAGFVWRDAYPDDHVCVTPAVRAQAANDNTQAAARRDPLWPGKTPYSPPSSPLPKPKWPPFHLPLPSPHQISLR